MAESESKSMRDLIKAIEKANKEAREAQERIAENTSHTGPLAVVLNERAEAAKEQLKKDDEAMKVRRDILGVSQKRFDRAAVLGSAIEKQKEIMEAQKKDLEAVGIDAEGNKAYRKEQLKLLKMERDQAKASGSKDAEAKAKKEIAELKSQTYLGKIAKGVTGMAKGALKAITSKLPSLETLLMTGGLAALLWFLKSPYFAKTKKFVEKELIPVVKNLYEKYIKPMGIWLKGKFLQFIKSLWEFIKNPSWGEAWDLIAENKVLMAALAAYLLGWKGVWAVIKGTMKAVGVALKLFNTEYRTNLLAKIKEQVKLVGKAIWDFMLKIKDLLISLKARYIAQVWEPLKKQVALLSGKVWEFMKKIPPLLVALKVFFVGTMIPAITGMAAGFAAMMIPFLPVIAIIAGIALVIYALWQGVKDAMTEFEATGSYWEAAKTLLMSFISNLIGFPLNMIKSLLSWVIGKIGEIFGIESFKNVSKIFDEFDFVDFFADGLKWIGDFISNMFGKLKDLAASILKKVGLGSVADWMFGTDEKQAEEKKAKAEEQRIFAEKRKALKEEQKLEKAKENAKKLEKRKAEQEALMPALKNAGGALTGPKGVTVPPEELERRRLLLATQKEKVAQATSIAIDAKKVQDNKKIVQITHSSVRLDQSSSAGRLARAGFGTKK